MTAKLIAEEGFLKGLVLELEKAQQEWIIGRDIDLCDFVLEDPMVSRMHLIMRKNEEGFEIENLSQTHPVLVNDVEIEKYYLLQSLDHLQIGATRFLFEAEGAEEYPSEEMDDFDHETIFSPPEESETPHFDLTESSRFILKVIAGPNTGAEFALEPGNQYLIGTDGSADILFNDLSVSSKHAEISISPQGEMTIEDLNSRNGVTVERERIIGKKRLLPNSVVFLGTTSFIILDREAESQTIMAPIYEPSLAKDQGAKEPEGIEPPLGPEPAVEPTAASTAALRKRDKSRGTWILSLMVAGLVLLLSLGLLSLFRVHEVHKPVRDYHVEIERALRPFLPAVTFNFNEATGKLFLAGHVATSVQKNELLYRLQALPFIQGVEDNVVNDEAIWQEMNLLLARHPDFKGVSMQAPSAGHFVLTGYLQTESQAASLQDYINVNFNYLALLDNRVVVEESVMAHIKDELAQGSFASVTSSFTNGELQLTGYITNAESAKFAEVLEQIKKIPGVRVVKNFVVSVSPEQGVIDLNRRYPNRYRVTGYSRHGDMSLNVVINGRILTRGDRLDDMLITSIQSHAVFLEKDGVKYKLTF